MKKFPLQKAKDKAVWLNFEHRTKTKRFGAIESYDGGYFVVDVQHPTFQGETFEVLPKDYSEMTYEQIQKIAIDDDPLKHWEEILGSFSVMDGELLRFILAKKIPLEKFIRYTLAARGFDENHNWCGFE